MADQPEDQGAGGREDVVRVARAMMLNGLRVLDAGSGMPPALIAKFLSDHGANVVMAPPSGDPSPDVWAAWPVWRADHGHRPDKTDDAVIEMAADVDICILGGEDFPGIGRKIDATALSARYPRLVVLRITGYPDCTADAGRPAVDILVQARSGMAFEHYRDRPLRFSFEPSLYGAVMHGLNGLFAALIDRERSGLGQIVSTSLYEGVLSWMVGIWTDVEKPTAYTQFVPPKDPYPLIFRCADGHFIHFVIGAPGSKYAIYQILGIDEPGLSPDDRGLPRTDADPRNFFGDYDLLEEHVRTWQCDALVEAISARGFPAVRVLAPGESWSDPQIILNAIIDIDAQGRRHVGSPVMIRTSHGDHVPPPAGPRPLSGMRIIDLGAYVAGPASSVVLADLGADVIKIEQPGGDPSRVMFRSFRASNRGKRVIGMDIKRGREIVLALCARADAVTSNFRTGVSERLGLDAATLHAVKPDLVVLESSAWGPVGPKSKVGGFDPVAQAYSGHERRGGGEGNVPLWSRTFVCDFACAAIGAVATLMALYHRAATGNGSTLNAPLINSGIYLLSELVQMPDGRFIGAPPLNAAQTGFHPAEAMYQTADGWVAIAARGDAAAVTLAERLGLALKRPVRDWGSDEEAAIANAVSTMRIADLAALLEPAGVWIEPCLRDAGDATMRNPALRAMGTIHVCTDSLLGEVAEIGPGMRFSRSARGAERGCPAIGEDTRTILAELGYTDDEVAGLYDSGVVK